MFHLWGHDVSPWPEKSHTDPVLLLFLGHINCCFCMGVIWHSNHTCPQQQQHPGLVGKEGHGSGAERLWQGTTAEVRGCVFCFLFFYRGWQGRWPLSFWKCSSIQISKDVYIFPSLWPLLLHVCTFIVLSLSLLIMDGIIVKINYSPFLLETPWNPWGSLDPSLKISFIHVMIQM